MNRGSLAVIAPFIDDPLKAKSGKMKAAPRHELPKVARQLRKTPTNKLHFQQCCHLKYLQIRQVPGIEGTCQQCKTGIRHPLKDIHEKAVWHQTKNTRI